MKIEEMKTDRGVTEQIGSENSNLHICPDDTKQVNCEKSDPKIEFIKQDRDFIDLNYWLPKSIGARRLLLVVSIIIFVYFVAFFFEEYNCDDFFNDGDDFGTGFGIMFLVSLSELVLYMTVVWVYRGFQKK